MLNQLLWIYIFPYLSSFGSDWTIVISLVISPFLNLIEINSVSFCLLWYINFIIFDCKFHKSHQFHILQYSDPNIKYKAHKFVLENL